MMLLDSPMFPFALRINCTMARTNLYKKVLYTENRCPSFAVLQPMHSPLDYFPSTEAAVSSKPSPNTLSLNGQWKFHLAANPTVSTWVHARTHASVM